VDAGLELQFRISALTGDTRDHLAITAVLSWIRAQDLDCPALPLGVAAIHPEQVAGEDRGFVAARPGTHFEEQVRVVVGIDRHEMHEQLVLESGEPPGELLVLVLGERAHVGIGARSQLSSSGNIALELAMKIEVAGDLVEARVLFRQLAKPVLVGDCRRVTEQPRDLFVPLDQLSELGAQRLLHLLAVNCGGGSMPCSAGIVRPCLATRRIRLVARLGNARMSSQPTTKIPSAASIRPAHVSTTSPTRRGSSHVEIHAASSAIGELW
jgi:hypothetical protein